MNSSLLLKYMTQSCTARQEEQVEHWLNESAQNRTTMEELKHILAVSPGKKIEVDTDKAWNEFSKQYFSPDEPKKQEDIEVSPPNGNKNFRRPKHRRLRRPAAAIYGAVAAAVVLLAVLFYYLAGVATPEGSAEVVSQKITTQKGQRTTVRLADGTRIHLNADSRLNVAAGYNSNKERVVYLEGEAFFEVASDRHRPFEVHTARAVTRVMGTKFNVNAYPDEEKVQVVVSEGKVAVGAGGRQTLSPEVRLTRYQKGVISADGEVTATKVSDLGVYLDWSRGRLTFRDTPIQKVERRLERWFDIEVTMDEGITSQNRRLTGSFKDVPLTSVLHSIALSLDMDYEREGRSVIFEDRG